MKFCPKCGALMLPKKSDEGAYYECECGYSEVGGDTKIVSQTKTESVKDLEIPNEETERLPICEAKCDKCGNSEAYYWEIQTRASDEPPTRFFKCTKCKYTWRDYS